MIVSISSSAFPVGGYMLAPSRRLIWLPWEGTYSRGSRSRRKEVSRQLYWYTKQC